MAHAKIEATLHDRIHKYQKVRQPWIDNFLPPDFDTALLELQGPFVFHPNNYRGHYTARNLPHHFHLIPLPGTSDSSRELSAPP